jgi:type III secretion system YscQ/HrcQ family protein
VVGLVTQPQRKRVRSFPLDRLPRLLRAQIDAAAALLRHVPQHPGPYWPDTCQALGGGVTLLLEECYARPASELPSEARGVAVKLAGPAGRWALVVLEPALAVKMCRRALGLDEEELAAPRALTVAEEGALEWLVGALAEGAARPMGVLTPGAIQLLAAQAAGEAWLLVAHARIEGPAGSGWVRLVAPDSLRHAAAPARSAAGLYARRARLEDAQVSMRLELGRTALKRADFAQLAGGDVVVFDRIGVRDPSGGPVALRLGRGGFAARLDGEALTIRDPFRLNLGASIMDETNPGTDQLLGELPVEVVCELGRVTMSGRELLELRPGAVIPVGRPLAGPVDLTVGGRVVARGELVDVEGEIGVRITQMND